MYVVMYISDLLCLILQEPNPFSFFQSHQLYTSRAPWQKQWGTHYNGKSVNAHRNIYIYINNENIGNILGCLVVQVHVYNEMQKKQNKTKQNKKTNFCKNRMLACIRMLAACVVFLFAVYQVMDSNSISTFICVANFHITLSAKCCIVFWSFFFILCTTKIFFHIKMRTDR